MFRTFSDNLARKLVYSDFAVSNDTDYENKENDEEEVFRTLMRKIKIENKEAWRKRSIKEQSLKLRKIKQQDVNGLMYIHASSAAE